MLCWLIRHAATASQPKCTPLQCCNTSWLTCCSSQSLPLPLLSCNRADDDDDFVGGGGGPLRRGAYPVSFGKQNPKHLKVIAEAQ